MRKRWVQGRVEESWWKDIWGEHWVWKENTSCQLNYSYSTYFVGLLSAPSSELEEEESESEELERRFDCRFLALAPGDEEFFFFSFLFSATGLLVRDFLIDLDLDFLFRDLDRDFLDLALLLELDLDRLRLLLRSLDGDLLLSRDEDLFRPLDKDRLRSLDLERPFLRDLELDLLRFRSSRLLLLRRWLLRSTLRDLLLLNFRLDIETRKRKNGKGSNN